MQAINAKLNRASSDVVCLAIVARWAYLSFVEKLQRSPESFKEFFIKDLLSLMTVRVHECLASTSSC